MLKLKTMTFRFLGTIAAIAMVLSTAQAQEFKKTILTGGPTGTYIQFGNDIAGLMRNCGQTLEVSESAGSLENFLGVRQRSNTQFGIVQSDVLEYLQTYSSNDPAIARAIRGVRIAFPLYNEEVHILAKKDISSLSGLAGKRVAVGVQDSGTFLTSSLILDLAGINVAERLTIGPDASMAQLQSGDIDAFFYVAGAPTKLFANSQINGDQLHLLPITDPILQSVYTTAKIPAGTYDFQPAATDVVAVKAILMTFEYRPNENNYHKQSCQAVADISNQIFTKFNDLKANGHPKWSQVDLTDIPPGWDISACVNQGLVVDYALTCNGAAQSGRKTEESSANAAYRERICLQIGC